MYVYSIAVLLIVFGGLITSKSLGLKDISKKKINNIFVYVTVAAFLILIVGLRSINIGTDTIAYIDLNHYISNNIQSLGQLLSDWYINTYLGYESGYLIYCYLLTKLGVSENIFILISALIALIPVMVLIYKKSDFPFLSLLFFVVFGMYSYSFNVLRQYLAIGLISIAYILFDKKGKKHISIFLIITAATIHVSAIVGLLLFSPLFVKSVTPTKLLLSYLLLILFLAAGSGMVDNLFSHFTKYKFTIQNGQKHYSTIVVLLLIYAYIIIKQNGRFEDKDKNYIILFYLYLVMQVAALFAGILSRMSLYFYIGIVIGLPNIILKKINRERFLVISVILLLFGVQYFKSLLSDPSLTPYIFGI